MLYSIIVTFIVIICVLLTIVVLLQPGQGEGLSGGLAGGMGGQGGPNMGARRTADFLSKSTAILGGAFLVLCVLANFAINRGDQTQSTIQQSGATSAPAEQNIDFDNPSQSPSAVPQSQQSGGDGSGSDQQSGGDGEGN